LSFARAGGAFEQQRLLEFRGQEDNLGHHGIDEVARGGELA
jgi:hypothetical protein